jgi:hypothetical protein
MKKRFKENMRRASPNDRGFPMNIKHTDIPRMRTTAVIISMQGSFCSVCIRRPCIAPANGMRRRETASTARRDVPKRNTGAKLPEIAG